VRSFEKVLDNHSSSVASSIYILSNSLLAAKARRLCSCNCL
jgi:hypothetical protein